MQGRLLLRMYDIVVIFSFIYGQIRNILEFIVYLRTDVFHPTLIANGIQYNTLPETLGVSRVKTKVS